MKQSKILKYGIGISILEIILIGIWFYVVRPESSDAFGILQITLLLFGINAILGLILYFLKNPFAVLFLSNSVMCPLIFYVVWIMWFTYFVELKNKLKDLLTLIKFTCLITIMIAIGKLIGTN